MQVLETPKRLIEELTASEAEQRSDQSGLSISFAVSACLQRTSPAHHLPLCAQLTQHL